MSSDVAKSMHSINFINESVEKNTFDDFDIFPVKRPEFVLPDVKTSTIDIPGGDGEIDLTESLAGRPVYSNRKGSFKFRTYPEEYTARKLKSQLANFLHGQRMRAILDEDPAYFYEGRFFVKDFEYKKYSEFADLTIDYNVGPYKMERIDSVEDWLWDPFNFETGVIRNYDFDIEGERTVKIIGAKNQPTPVFKTVVKWGLEPDVKLVFEGKEYWLEEGDTIIEEITLGEQEYDMKFIFDGGANVKVVFRGGSL